MGVALKFLATLLAFAIIILLASSSLALSQYVEISTEFPPLQLKNVTLTPNQEFYLKICGPSGAIATFYLYELFTGSMVYNTSFLIGPTGCTILGLKAPDKHGLYVAMFNIGGSVQMLLLRVGPSPPLPRVTVTVTVTSTTTTVENITVTRTVTVTKTLTTATTLHVSSVQPVTIYVTEYSISPLAPKIVLTKVYGITTTITTTTTIYKTSTVTVTMPVYQTIYKTVKSEIPITKTNYRVVRITETKVVKETVPKPVLVREYLVNVSSIAAALVLGAAVGAAIMLVYTRR